MQSEIKNLENSIQQRDFQLTATRVEDNDELIEISCSSEYLVDRGYYKEVLQHDKSSIRLDRFKNSAAVLVNHGGDQVGVVENAWIDEGQKKLRAQIRFSKSEKGRELKQDVDDGIRRNVSIGYRIHKLVLESETEGVETFRIIDWEPYEVSMVGVPADPSVGVKRALEIENIQNEKNKGAIKMAEEKVVINESQVDPKLEEKRQTEIKAIGERYSLPFDFALRSDMSVSAYKEFALDQTNKKERTVQVGVDNAVVDLSKKEQKQYSLRNAIINISNGIRSGLEFEISEELEKRFGKPTKSSNSFFVPSNLQKRDLNTTDDAGVVSTFHNGGSFIELLRNKQLATQLGVQRLTGLSSNQKLPKQTGGAAGYWVAEASGAITESEATFSQVSLTPHRVGALTEFSKELLAVSDPSIDMLVMNDLTTALALAIDKAVFHGTGDSGQPTGIAATSGIGAVTAATFDWAKAVEFETDVTAGNVDSNNMFFATTPAVRGTLKSRAKETGYPVYIIENNMMNGYDVLTSNQISSGFIFFGDFSHALIAEFGAVEILINPYKKSEYGLIEVTAQHLVDVGVRQAAAFSMGSSFS